MNAANALALAYIAVANFVSSGLRGRVEQSQMGFPAGPGILVACLVAPSSGSRSASVALMSFSRPGARVVPDARAPAGGRSNNVFDQLGNRVAKRPSSRADFRFAGQVDASASTLGFIVRLGGRTMKPQELEAEASTLTREEEQAEVIRRLEEDIIFGRFAPGSRLVEDTLMTRYGASRHFLCVRGLFQLERQGIVLREKNIGATAVSLLGRRRCGRSTRYGMRPGSRPDDTCPPPQA